MSLHSRVPPKSLISPVIRHFLEPPVGVACYFVGRREPRMVRIVTQVSHNNERCYLFLSEMRLPMLRDSAHLEPLCDYHCESRRYASCCCLGQGIKEAP